MDTMGLFNSEGQVGRLILILLQGKQELERGSLNVTFGSTAETLPQIRRVAASRRLGAGWKLSRSPAQSGQELPLGLSLLMLLYWLKKLVGSGTD
jgi:hypothetical protein